jgi:cell division protein FtsL
MNTLSKEWALSVAFSLFLMLVFGLGLVWLNIERVDLAYDLNQIQRNIDETEALVAKLEVERNTLITPQRLRALAAHYGLGPARAGQIRRISDSGDVTFSPLTGTLRESLEAKQ